MLPPPGAVTWRCCNGRGSKGACGTKTGGANRRCKDAAHRGNLEVLKWAREQHCPWNSATCAYAAMGGARETLQWLREHNCPWDEGNVAQASL